MLIKHFLTLVLALSFSIALIACDQREPIVDGPTAVAFASPRMTPAILPTGSDSLLLTGAGPRTALVINAGQTAIGEVKVTTAGKVVAFSVELGTFANTSTGMLNLRLCDAGKCVTGIADLRTSLDNSLFSIALSAPLEVAAGDSLTYSLTKVGGDIGVAIWTYPAIGKTQKLSLSNGSTSNGRMAELALRYAP